MQIKKYGIVLERMQEADCELVRTWRNSEHVRLNMHYQGLITADMQQTWFSNLEKSKNLYFIICTNGVKVGLVNLKDIHPNLKTAEAGIFIGDKNYLRSMVPVLATVVIMELAFQNLGLNLLRAKMSATNDKVIEFNKRLGYLREEYQSDNQFHYYHTNAERFNDAIEGIRDTLGKMGNGLFEIEIEANEMRELHLTPAAFSIKGLKLRINS